MKYLTLHNLDEVLELFTNQDKDEEDEDEDEEDGDEELEDEEDSHFGKVRSQTVATGGRRDKIHLGVFPCFFVYLQESWTMKFQHLCMKTEAMCWIWTRLPK